jgi:ferredoxin
MNPGDRLIIDRSHFDSLLAALREAGYRPVGPTVRDGAIVYDDVRSVADLPAGWTDEQAGGHYRLKRRADDALFGYAVGPQSWKRFLHPPVLRLWRARRAERGFEIVEETDELPHFAFIGVRSCELHAIAVQDRVFLSGPQVDPAYKARRDAIFVVALNCGQAGGTCFCASMKTGPRVTAGFDLALTELLGAGRHAFLVEIGTERGAEMLKTVSHRPPCEADLAEAEAVVQATAAGMGRALDADGLKELLYASYESPRWEQVAQRCLACTNCTMVCPTCFCATVEDVTDLSGGEAERVRRWDSCFTLDFSYIHGGSVRSSGAARYRQWITHKLASWQDQFGTSGCVGCGRCITWCPVGIDITEEVHAIRQSESQRGAGRVDRDL